MIFHSYVKLPEGTIVDPLSMSIIDSSVGIYFYLPASVLPEAEEEDDLEGLVWVSLKHAQIVSNDQKASFHGLGQTLLVFNNSTASRYMDHTKVKLSQIQSRLDITLKSSDVLFFQTVFTPLQKSQ